MYNNETLFTYNGTLMAVGLFVVLSAYYYTNVFFSN